MERYVTATTNQTENKVSFNFLFLLGHILVIADIGKH